MKSSNIVILAVLLALLNGCVFSYDKQAKQADISNAASENWISEKWLSESQSDIQLKIVSYIKDRYTDIPENMAGISVRSVSVRNDVVTRNRSEVRVMEANLKALFDGATNEILGYRTTTVPVDVEVEFFGSKSSKIDAAVYFATLPICFGSVFIVCPGGGENYVVIDALLTDSSGDVIKVTGVGASSYFSTSILAGDSLDSDSEANSKALVAAIADVSEKVVPYLKNSNAIQSQAVFFGPSALRGTL